MLILPARGFADGDGAPQPAPELLSLEQTLIKTQTARDRGDLALEKYQEFAASFRKDVDATMNRIPKTAANTIVQSRLLSRLGDSRQALASIDQALKQDPRNAPLKIAKGFALYEQKDFPSAAEQANSVLRDDPGNQGALWLKHTIEDPSAPKLKLPSSPWETLASPGTPGRTSGKRDDSNLPVHLAIQGSLKTVDVPSAQTKETPSPSSKDPLPLWPLTVPLGTGLLGYGIYRSKQTYASEEGLNPDPDVPPDQARRNYINSAVLVGTPILALGLVYAGPALWTEVAPAVSALWAGGAASAQRIATSEAGAILPAEAPAIANGAAKSIQGFTAVEAQVISEAQSVLASPQFAELQEAYKAGRPAVVNIGGRVIQYEPDIPMGYSGITDFKGNGFALGRQAFSSAQEMQKTVLHELYRLVTTESAQGVDAGLAANETNAAFTFAERAVKALKK